MLDDDKKELRDRAQDEKIARDQELEDIKSILKTGSGVRFFRRFLEEGSIFSSTFTGNSQTFFLEGKRSFALKYFSDICEACPDKVAEIMIREGNE